MDQFGCWSCGADEPAPLTDAQQPTSFVFQADSALKVEKATIQHACALGNDLHVGAYYRLAEISRLKPGALRHQAGFCPIGTVEFCRALMRATGVQEPEPLDYPDVLAHALHRLIRRTTYGQAAVGSWVKPVAVKAWPAHVLQDRGRFPPDEPVWDAPVIPEQDWLAEWRVYILHGRIVGYGRYDAGEDEDLVVNMDQVQHWADLFQATGQAPDGYALDVALWPNGRTVLVEVTDGWAIGYYNGTCPPTDYARLCAARWAQIAQASAGTR